MNLKELARTLGLSQTTVSRALNGYQDVAAKTRRRVAQAAKEHNYRPSRRARSLATGRSRRVAIMAGTEDGNGLKDPVFCAFLSGATDELERQNFDWVIRQPNVRDGGSQIAQLARDDSLEGAILTAPSQDDQAFAATASSRFPIVVRGDFSGRDSTVSAVDYDHRLAMHCAVTSLADVGHRHIALITGPRDHVLTQTQLTAFKSAMKRSGLHVSPGALQAGPHTHQFGMNAVHVLSDITTVPTALVVGGSIIAAGVVAGLMRLASNTERPMSYLYYDDGLSWLNDGPSPDSFARLSTPAAALGREAATRLIQQISAPDTVSDVRLLAPGFVLNQAIGSERLSFDAPAHRAILPRHVNLS